MIIKFPFEKKRSPVFGTVYRPVVSVLFWSRKISGWEQIPMIVDTGADYTLLPSYLSHNLGVNLKKDCLPYTTQGVGGKETVRLLKSWRVKIDQKELFIPLGFLDKDNIPPLLGRQGFLEILKMTMENHVTTFEF